MSNCVYCNAELTKENKTKDDIPSRGLFPKGKNIKNPIKIPACYSCNQKFSGDEEWFRYFLVNFCQDKSFMADQMFWTKIKSSIEKSPGKGNILKSKMKVVDHWSESKIYLGKKTAIEISSEDWKKYYNVLDKYAKGIFYFQTGKRLDDLGFVIKHRLIDPKILSPELIKTLKFNLDNETVFLYGTSQVPTTNQMVIVTVFYENVNFISFIAKPGTFKNFG